MKLIDISQPVGATTAVWPGDQPFHLSWTLQQERGDSVNVAALSMSAHTGTHTDGGYHVSADGARAADLPLDAYLGPARVIDARGRARLDEAVLADVDLSITRRILFRTRDHIDPAEFPRSFLSPTPALAQRLASAGLLLIGSDAPSMDPMESRSLETHKIFAAAGVAILENLVLTDVEPGVYTLIALPLKLVDADSSPVRAVLIDDGKREDMKT